MTWRGERRKRLPADWAQRRRMRLDIDDGRCTWVDQGARCNADATDVDHWFDSEDHRIQSLRSLCDAHHKRKTQLEAQAARGVGVKRLRPRAPHPGFQ